jgi:hypothetical protein
MDRIILQDISHNKTHIHHIINIAFNRFFLSFLFDLGIIDFPMAAEAIKKTHISQVAKPFQSKLVLFEELEFSEYACITVGSFCMYKLMSFMDEYIP